MLHDYIARRIVHPVYLLGICVILFMKFGRFPLLRSESWQTFVDWIAAFY